VPTMHVFSTTFYLMSKWTSLERDSSIWGGSYASLLVPRCTTIDNTHIVRCMNIRVEYVLQDSIPIELYGILLYTLRILYGHRDRALSVLLYTLRILYTPIYSQDSPYPYPILSHRALYSYNLPIELYTLRILYPYTHRALYSYTYRDL
jgi:hypothetical protein